MSTGTNMLRAAVFNFRTSLIKNAMEEIKTKLNEEYFFNTVLIKAPLDMTDASFLNLITFRTTEFEKFVLFCKSLGLKIILSSRFSTPYGSDRRIYTKYVEHKIKYFVGLGITDFFCDTSVDVNSEKNYNLFLTFLNKNYPDVTLLDNRVLQNPALIFTEKVLVLNKKESQTISMLFFPVGKLDLTVTEIPLKHADKNCSIYLLNTIYYGIEKNYLLIANNTNNSYIVKKKHIEQHYHNCFEGEQIILQNKEFYLFLHT